MGFLYFFLGLVIGVVAGVLVMKKYGAMVVAAIQSLEATLKSAIQRIESAIQRVESAIKAAKGIVGLLLLALGLSLAAQQAKAATATQQSTQYQHIANTWNAPNTTYPLCSPTVTLSCLSTYTYSATDPNGAANISTVPNGGIAPGGVVSYTWGPSGFLLCGTWTVSVVANYVDAGGAPVTSSADTVTAAVSCPLVASPATALKGTPAQ